MGQADALGFVLAGGHSSRMGADKALELFAGQPLVAHAVSVLRQAGLTASIAGARSLLAAFAPVVEDSQPGMGPLGGICAALASTSACLSVFLPVDLPLLPASLLVFLLHHARTTGSAVTLCSVNGFAQSFPAVLRREILPLLQSELEAGRGGCYSAFQAAAASLGQPVSVLPVELLIQSGHVAHPGDLIAARWFLNVNTPEDLRRAEAARFSASAA
jgi:molybdopterin-guanine dinucleotide biosynthesis protein A